MKLLRTENDVIELAGRIQAALPSITDAEQMEKATGFLVQSIMGRQISLYDGLIRTKKKQLDEAIIKLQQELEGHTQGASEVKDQRVIRATEWVRQQEEQLEFLEDYAGRELAHAKEAFKAFFGKSWVPYSTAQNMAAKLSQTAARAEAEELLAKYRK